MPRRSPSPSSPTLPAKRMSPGVVNFAASSVRTSARIEREPARVVADAGGRQPRALRASPSHRCPSGNTVSRWALTSSSGPARRTGAAADAHHVAFGIHLDVGQADLAEHLQVDLRARLLLERRRRDFGQRDQLPHEAVLVGLDEGGGLLEFRAVDEGADPASGDWAGPGRGPAAARPAPRRSRTQNTQQRSRSRPRNRGSPGTGKYSCVRRATVLN